MNARSGLMETFKITNGSSDISRYILNPMMLEEEGIIKKLRGEVNWKVFQAQLRHTP